MTQQALTEDLRDAIRGTYKALAERFPGFKPRRSQRAMVGIAANALGVEGGRAVVEAPTGTGKSLAYLAAAVPLALAQERKLVVSTGTIALQEQLVERDIPAFLKATGLHAKVALAKGRNHYACTHRLVQLAEEDKGDPQDALFDGAVEAHWPRPPRPGEVEKVVRLAEQVVSGVWGGDLDATPEPVPADLKAMMTIPGAACIGKRCPFYDTCPARMARARVREADIVVSNHDLTLISLEQSLTDPIRPNILAEPAQAMYVIDEGHQLAETAVQAGARQAGMKAASKRLERMRGLVTDTFKATGAERIAGMEPTQALEALGSLRENIDTFLSTIDREWPADGGEQVYRGSMGEVPEAWRTFAGTARASAARLLGWLQEAQARADKVEQKGQAADRRVANLAMATEEVGKLGELFGYWSAASTADNPVAKWIERTPRGGVTLHAAPVLPGVLLDALLWENAGSVLVTSATLSTGGNFTYLANEIGAPESTQYAALPSPFNLHEQAVVEIPPFPCLPDSPDHAEQVARWMEAHMDWDVATLVLFTSRRKMEATYAALSPEYQAWVEVQGVRTRAEQIRGHVERVRAGKRSVLMGLMSLGVGLDLGGDLLEHVVITQIPFAVPTDPIGATRAEWIERAGGNAFFDVALPAATRTLVQFAGRLIRTETDTGRITLTDRRLVAKRYGADILKALPPFRQQVAR